MARRKLSSEINVVPYIDVMLVLLIIFMVTAPLLTQGIEVDLPDVDAQSMNVQQEERILSIKSDGQYFMGFGGPSDVAVDDAEITRRVQEALAKTPDAMILVQGDGKVAYERVAHAMSVLNQAGAKRIGFVTEPAPQNKK